MDGKPSITAFLVADGLLQLSQDPNYSSLVPLTDVLYLRAFTDEWRRSRADWIASHQEEFNKVCTPVTDGILQHYAARKRYIEKQVEEAVAQGCTSVVNISAGYDLLSLKMKRNHPDLHCIELDHPATQDVKKAALLPADRAKIDWVAADWDSQRLKQMLAGKIHPHEKTVYVLEGVTPYLTEPQFKRLLEDIRAVSGKNAELVVGIISSLPQALKSAPDRRFREAQRDLARQSEGYKYSKPYEAVGEVLRQSGFYVTDSRRMGELQKEFRPMNECARIDAQPSVENYFTAITNPLVMKRAMDTAGVGVAI